MSVPKVNELEKFKQTWIGFIKEYGDLEGRALIPLAVVESNLIKLGDIDGLEKFYSESNLEYQKLIEKQEKLKIEANAILDDYKMKGGEFDDDANDLIVRLNHYSAALGKLLKDIKPTLEKMKKYLEDPISAEFEYYIENDTSEFDDYKIKLDKKTQEIREITEKLRELKTIMPKNYSDPEMTGWIEVYSKNKAELEQLIKEAGGIAEEMTENMKELLNNDPPPLRIYPSDDDWGKLGSVLLETINPSGTWEKNIAKSESTIEELERDLNAVKLSQEFSDFMKVKPSVNTDISQLMKEMEESRVELKKMEQEMRDSVTANDEKVEPASLKVDKGRETIEKLETRIKNEIENFIESRQKSHPEMNEDQWNYIRGVLRKERIDPLVEKWKEFETQELSTRNVNNGIGLLENIYPRELSSAEQSFEKRYNDLIGKMNDLEHRWRSRPLNDFDKASLEKMNSELNEIHNELKSEAERLGNRSATDFQQKVKVAFSRNGVDVEGSYQFLLKNKDFNKDLRESPKIDQAQKAFEARFNAFSAEANKILERKVELMGLIKQPIADAKKKFEDVLKNLQKEVGDFTANLSKNDYLNEVEFIESNKTQIKLWAKVQEYEKRNTVGELKKQVMGKIKSLLAGKFSDEEMRAAAPLLQANFEEFSNTGNPVKILVKELNSADVLLDKFNKNNKMVKELYEEITKTVKSLEDNNRGNGSRNVTRQINALNEAKGSLENLTGNVEKRKHDISTIVNKLNSELTKPPSKKDWFERFDERYKEGVKNKLGGWAAFLKAFKDVPEKLVSSGQIKSIAGVISDSVASGTEALTSASNGLITRADKVVSQIATDKLNEKEQDSEKAPAAKIFSPAQPTPSTLLVDENSPRSSKKPKG